MLAELFVFVFVRAFFDGSVDDIAQFIETDLLINTYRGDSMQQIHLIVIRAVERNYHVCLLYTSDAADD